MAACVGLVLPAATACTEDRVDAPPPEPSSQAVPLPAGVALSEPGSTLEVGEAAVTVLPTAERDTVLSVTVSAIRRGSREDFFGYRLDPLTARSTPWYVDASMRVLGRSSLERATRFPLYGLDSTDTFFPAATVKGSFPPCEPVDVTDGLRRGETARGCLLFFVPPDATLEAIQLRTRDTIEPVSWPVPASRRPGARHGPGHNG